jgi:Kef-type K+ transport system membrane component KefB
MIEPASSLSLRELENLGHELLGSVALGTTLGLVLAAYMRLVGKQLILVFVALGFGLTEMLRYLSFDALLTFMVAGFVVQNLSKQGERFVKAIGETGSIVFVVFFATAGAHLDVPLLRTLWPVALLLAVARALTTFVASRIAARAAGDPPAVHRWAWAGLVSQAGLTLGLSSAVERAFPTFGPAFRSLAIATVALNEMVGPVLFKLALDRSGESWTGPRPSLSSLSERSLPAKE